VAFRRAKSTWPKRVLPAAALLVPLVLPVISARADGPVVHEYFEPNPEEDLRFSATTADGAMPAAIETPVGVVTAPPTGRRAERDEVAYGGSSTPDSADASYQIDRDTTRPDRVGYDEPFTPSIAPFKRLYAYDAVDESLELVVADKRLTKIVIGGNVEVGEDTFYADLFVDAVPNVPVRIPSVGPGARVLVARLDPAEPFELLRDSADNWFLLASIRRRVRLVMQLAIARAVFSSPFASVSWSALRSSVSPLPPAAHQASERVLSYIGVARDEPPREALQRLVRFHRSFVPSEELPRARQASLLYEELSMSQKGVCRHRAYAFVITALGLGLPARLARNEAHAWIEVFDGQLWHRIDLGGAATDLDYRSSSDNPLYQAPDDPYPWPQGSETGQSLALRAQERQSTVGPAPDRAPASVPSSSPDGGLDAFDDSESNQAESSDRPNAELFLTLERSSVLRGSAVAMSGTVRADGEPCPFARVDVGLRNSAGRSLAIAALPTDAAGKFTGRVSVPLDVAVGDYELVVSTPGAGPCGPSRRSSP